MYSRKISDLNYIKELSLNYVIQNNDGLFCIDGCWDKEEASCYNVDYYAATSYFKKLAQSLNTSDGGHKR